MDTVLSIWDFFLTPIYILVICVIGYIIKNTQIKKKSEYKYFLAGLTFKLLGGIAFALVYVFYYDGGDTHSYFLDACSLGRLFFKEPSAAFSILMNNLTPENHTYFNIDTGWPHNYVWRDPNTYTVARYTSILTFFSFRTYIPTTLIVSSLSYIGIWKLFMLFTHFYKENIKFLAISILFMPSFIFWGSGIMKDTYIVGATCWFTYNFYRIFINRSKVLINFLFLVMNFIIILNIKPYVISCMIPCMLLWLNQSYMQNVKSSFIKVVIMPILLIGLTFSGVVLFSNIGDSMGDYGDFDSAIQKAKITQEDLLRESQYGSNNYNLGEIDGSISSLLRIGPLAIFTTLYRPFLSEIGNILMALSALENFILLIFTIVVIMKIRPYKMIQIIKNDPLILYSIVFSIMFAFGVGIATANFGALVRYKIPLIPFYFSSLFLIYQIAKNEKKQKR
ncbi:hypothetical protein FRY74_03575 [Vicingus serpentipes]|uniref:Glycosyltransferase RgtA/B/C/D-like domain-containing protein n=1 Tax=Vicingus serpentipes TaxID=1926625 RepID=A0A5C6RY27_9FLAO|nr:hypothetical protein [Vicingus serpentipes]TXB67278.1 hypothetical protein FRY74_03575 [Vicingus serpentipes]